MSDLASTLHVQSFRKRPVSIQAAQFNGKNGKAIAAWINENGGEAKSKGSYMLIHTKEGVMKARKWDMIIRGVEGEFYPCNFAIFEKTYSISKKHFFVNDKGESCLPVLGN